MEDSFSDKLLSLSRSSIEDLKRLKNLLRRHDSRPLITIKVFHKGEGSVKLENKEQ
jgi:hypothetical protein